VRYRTDDAGAEIRTQRRDDVLAALADAGQGTLVAADLPDQAGAVRELVAGMRRGALAEARTTRGRARAWIPVLVGAVVLGLHAWTRPTAALIGAVLGRAGARGGARRRSASRTTAERAWDAGDRRGRRRRAPTGVATRHGVVQLRRRGTRRGDAKQARTARWQRQRTRGRARALFNLGVLALSLAERFGAP
jgi:hypothetical protein